MMEEILKLPLISYLKGNLFSILHNCKTNFLDSFCLVRWCFLFGWFFFILRRKINFLAQVLNTCITANLISDVLPNNNAVIEQICYPSVRTCISLSFIFQLNH